MFFCCRTDGDPDSPVELPRGRNFGLLKYGDKCQVPLAFYLNLHVVDCSGVVLIGAASTMCNKNFCQSVQTSGRFLWVQAWKLDNLMIWNWSTESCFYAVPIPFFHYHASYCQAITALLVCLKSSSSDSPYPAHHLSAACKVFPLAGFTVT